MQVNAIPLPGEGVVLFCPSPTPLPVSKGERKDHFAFTSGLHDAKFLRRLLALAIENMV